MSSTAIDFIKGQIKGDKGSVEVKIDISKKAENHYSFTILPLKPGRRKSKQVIKPIGADLRLRHVMDNTFYVFSDATETQSFMVEVHDQEEKKAKYLPHSCNDELDQRFSSQDTPVALPKPEDWDQNTDENARKKVVLVENTQESQFEQECPVGSGHSISSNLRYPSARPRTPQHPSDRANTLLQMEVVTTTNTTQASEETRDVVNAFQSHYGELANAKALKTTFDRDVGAAALEIAKASFTTQAAKKQVGLLFNSNFRPALRELCLYYGITKISPDEFGKKGKKAFHNALLELFQRLCPDQYCLQVRESLQLELANALQKINMQSLIIKVPMDIKLRIDNTWYLGDDADIKVDLEASTSTAETNETSQLVAFTNWLAQEPNPTTCIMDWASTINEVNFRQFPLLEIDPTAGCVKNEKSKFDGMRLPKSFTEWISQLYFIILTTFASISTNALAASDGGLVHRCRNAANMMREGSTTLLDIINKTFLKSAGVEGTFFGTNLFWKVIGDKGHIGETSQFRLALLFIQRVKRNYAILQTKSGVIGRELSVKNMFDRTSGSRKRPVVADLDADDFNVDTV